MTEGEIYVEYDMRCNICDRTADTVVAFWYETHRGSKDGVYICLSCLYRAVNMLKNESSPVTTSSSSARIATIQR